MAYDKMAAKISVTLRSENYLNCVVDTKLSQRAQNVSRNEAQTLTFSYVFPSFFHLVSLVSHRLTVKRALK